MTLAQTLVSMLLGLRKKANLKVRQPLGVVMVPVSDERSRMMLESIRDLVLSEVNAKELRIVSADEGVLVKRVKPDFKKLGPKLGKNMKQAAAAIQALGQAEIARFEKDGRMDVSLADGSTATIDVCDVEIFSEDIPGWMVSNEGSVTVALDITVTPELRREGIARDIVNRIQNIRKDRDYNITDRITLVFEPNAETDDALKEFGEYISRQVLATALTVEPLADDAPGLETLDIDGLQLRVAIMK
ncbi:MAG: isoleucine--tRNA ligase, partial [Muribaculaceae bacterium]|nr:isoleucine--tRNA ligase [Muribaculaceae bacterium]